MSSSSTGGKVGKNSITHSEVAYLVLLYLKEAQFDKSYTEFVVESEHLTKMVTTKPVRNHI